MKKTYTKPEIIFEDFTASTNIAAGCEGPAVGHAKDSCFIQGTGNIRIFDDGMNQCEYTPFPGDPYDGYCYHTPTDSNNLFNS